MRKIFLSAALGVTAITLSAPAASQQSGLVNVDVSNVLNNLDIDLLNNSLNNNQVQVGIGVAANVCGTTVALLVADMKDDGRATCTASSVNDALKQAARRQAVPKEQ